MPDWPARYRLAIAHRLPAENRATLKQRRLGRKPDRSFWHSFIVPSPVLGGKHPIANVKANTPHLIGPDLSRSGGRIAVVCKFFYLYINLLAP